MILIVTLNVFALMCVGIVAMEWQKRKQDMREIVESSKDGKFNLKKYEDFDLTEDQLTLKSTKDGKDVYQNFMLLNEPSGLCFQIKEDYVVEIKFKRLKEKTKQTEVSEA